MGIQPHPDLREILCLQWFFCLFVSQSYSFNFIIQSVIYKGSLALCCGYVETTVSM